MNVYVKTEPMINNDGLHYGTTYRTRGASNAECEAIAHLRGGCNAYDFGGDALNQYHWDIAGDDFDAASGDLHEISCEIIEWRWHDNAAVFQDHVVSGKLPSWWNDAPEDAHRIEVGRAEALNV